MTHDEHAENVRDCISDLEDAVRVAWADGIPCTVNLLFISDHESVAVRRIVNVLHRCIQRMVGK